MHKTIHIRHWAPTDLEALARLNTELGYPTTVEATTEQMAIIATLNNYVTAVAEVDGQVVGYVGFVNNYFWEQSGHFIRIQALVVQEACRKFGVGKQLIEYVEAHARSIGAKLLVLNCSNRESRAAAHRFYPSVGFEVKSTGYIKNL
jgi:GNAT superfamily N-acetyltransferase